MRTLWSRLEERHVLRRGQAGVEVGPGERYLAAAVAALLLEPDHDTRLAGFQHTLSDQRADLIAGVVEA